MTAPVILLTGAAGRIGSMLRQALPADAALTRHLGAPACLRVTDIVDPGPGDGADEVFAGDLADPAFTDVLFRDGRVAAVVHMAGYPREADWSVLLDANIRGAINLWEAARRAGTGRVLYASSNHTVGLYPRTTTIDDQVTQRPDSRYGVTKAFAEEMAFLYAWKFGVRGFGMRIGSFLPEPDSHRALATWVSPRDMAALVVVGLTADYVCEIVYGVSDNAAGFWDNAAASRMGYRPRDSADAYAGRVPPPTDDPIAERFQGGAYVPAGLAEPARLERIDADG